MPSSEAVRLSKRSGMTHGKQKTMNEKEKKGQTTTKTQQQMKRENSCT